MVKRWQTGTRRSLFGIRVAAHTLEDMFCQVVWGPEYRELVYEFYTYTSWVEGNWAFSGGVLAVGEHQACEIYLLGPVSCSRQFYSFKSTAGLRVWLTSLQNNSNV